MTTIAYKDGVMAGDSRAYSTARTPIGSKVKVERLSDGTLIGVSSSIAGGAETVREWWSSDRNPDIELPASFHMLVAKPNGEVYYACDTHHVSGPLIADHFAIGSGNEYALGAMANGCSAVDAVRIGCKLDVWSAMPIYAVRHDGQCRWRVDL